MNARNRITMLVRQSAETHQGDAALVAVFDDYPELVRAALSEPITIRACDAAGEIGRILAADEEILRGLAVIEARHQMEARNSPNVGFAATWDAAADNHPTLFQ